MVHKTSKTQSSKKNASAALTQSEACAVEIMDLIRNGEYLPGAKLSEYSLAERLSYGLNPVKIALNNLAEGGILERRSRSGTYVRNISLSDYLNLLEIRTRLEGLAAAQATPLISPEELDHLDILGRELDNTGGLAAADDGKERLFFIQKDTDFHMAIAQASGNPFLVEVLSKQHLLHLCFLYALNLTPKASRRQLSGVRHYQIIEAMRQRDAAKADLLMQRHIVRIREFLL